MANNPYDGQEPYGTAWQQGYEHGVANPSDTSPQAPDYSSWGYDEETTGYIGQVWQEGALAGREEGSGGQSGGEPGGQSGGGEGEITLPADLAAEMASFADYYPETTAIAYAGDGDAFYQQYLGFEPETDDEPVA